jgi:hypothetical protein
MRFRTEVMQVPPRRGCVRARIVKLRRLGEYRLQRLSSFLSSASPAATSHLPAWFWRARPVQIDP